jgi:hypothetical protein
MAGVEKVLGREGHGQQGLELEKWMAVDVSVLRTVMFFLGYTF